MATAMRSPLVELSGEPRNAIYEYVALSSTTTVTMVDGDYRKPSCHLAATCHQSCKEYLPILRDYIWHASKIQTTVTNWRFLRFPYVVDTLMQATPNVKKSLTITLSFAHMHIELARLALNDWMAFCIASRAKLDIPYLPTTDHLRTVQALGSRLIWIAVNAVANVKLS
ncbi:hypothetical protein BAUCODRAFT_395609 [Baudoinia panamericana UAMH 10762]|uniref:Uncharacterized protein n=1 Tax=Baudoinia panamericana (strain UAMH 10762) TaxID=717646 RepID=M2N5B6_BAUPA|nr:uncharacterized protein BAUCODRAFT_395609 [Baudoinia panamericana UAMH 10762]EMC99223.1 hypothetical protein BAUCODRAFT_395609 [Baudoinia panamericana UAMH 10762]